DEATVKDESERRHKEDPATVSPFLKNPKMEYWIVRIHLANDEHHEHDCRKDQSPRNPGRREPILLLALIQNNLKAADTDGKHSNRNIDVEDPTPGIVVRQPTSQNRAKHWRHHNAQTPYAHRLSLLSRRKGFKHHGLRDRLQNTTGESLDDPESNKPGQAGSEATEKRSRCESNYSGHQQTFPPK